MNISAISGEIFGKLSRFQQSENFYPNLSKTGTHCKLNISLLNINYHNDFNEVGLQNSCTSYQGLNVVSFEKEWAQMKGVSIKHTIKINFKLSVD